MGCTTISERCQPLLQKVVVYQDGMGRTSNPYADGRTPAWNTSSHTPNPSAGGGKTLAWKKNTQPDGGTMPAWNALSDSETPEFICVWRCSSWTVMGDATAARSNSNAGNPEDGYEADWELDRELLVSYKHHVAMMPIGDVFILDLALICLEFYMVLPGLEMLVTCLY
ncbi:hypothetical protein JOM56_013687 [Amanita muscaria]